MVKVASPGFIVSKFWCSQRASAGNCYGQPVRPSRKAAIQVRQATPPQLSGGPAAGPAAGRLKL